MLVNSGIIFSDEVNEMEQHYVRRNDYQILRIKTHSAVANDTKLVQYARESLHRKRLGSKRASKS